MADSLREAVEAGRRPGHPCESARDQHVDDLLAVLDLASVCVDPEVERDLGDLVKDRIIGWVTQ